MSRKEFLLANTPVTEILETREYPSATIFTCNCAGDICKYAVRGTSERDYQIYER